MRIAYERRDVAAIEPKRAHATDAGFDLTAIEKVELVPHGRALVDTGIAIEIPPGYCSLVLPRSGLALKEGLTVLNAPGLIDSGYRGTIKVLLWNTNDAGQVKTVHAGDRIAQLVIVNCTFEAFLAPVETLTGTARSDGGFGSTDQPAAA